MKSSWLIKEGREKLILFFSGWGMDSTPFNPLKSENYDVLCLYNYAEEGTCDLDSLSTVYSSITLVGWSMGVFFAWKNFAAVKDRFVNCVAINGTLCPVDDDLGIPETIFRSTLENLTEESLLKFNKRMCLSSEVLTQFMGNRPKRTIDDQKKELEFIYYNTQSEKGDTHFFSKCIVSSRDRIVPTKNQKKFWGNGRITQFTGAHFLFYDVKSWDEIVV